MLPRPRHLSISRVSDQAICSPKPRMSTEFPVVIKGDLFVLGKVVMTIFPGS
jgi:hypothetical protein